MAKAAQVGASASPTGIPRTKWWLTCCFTFSQLPIRSCVLSRCGGTETELADLEPLVGPPSCSVRGRPSARIEVVAPGELLADVAALGSGGPGGVWRLPRVPS